MVKRLVISIKVILMKKEFLPLNPDKQRQILNLLLCNIEVKIKKSLIFSLNSQT